MTLSIEPQNVFHWFYQLNQIPRESGHEEKVSQFLMDFANDRGLEVHQDQLLNIIIKKPAAAGYENAEPVIIQGHMDMVCVKTKETVHDFEKDPIQMFVEDGFLKAKETTLGADNGIAVAMILAILDGNYKHPKLECLITTNEETNMSGAGAVNPNLLSGTRLLNIDSEEEGIFLTSCAGGETDTFTFQLEKENIKGYQVDLEVSGLRGGHSGQEIIKERANANIVLFRILNAIAAETNLYIVHLEGGSKDNVIPNNASATIIVSDLNKAQTSFDLMLKDLKVEFESVDPDLSVFFSAAEQEEELQAYTKALTEKLIAFFMVLPDGVQTMSPDVKGLVQTSLNNAIMLETEDSFQLITSLRSSVESNLTNLSAKLAYIAQFVGCGFEQSDFYSGWHFEPNSPLRDLCLKVHQETFNEEATYDAIHAGLECGMLKKILPKCDMISYGPNLYDVHTADEKLDIASAERIWQFTLNLLESMN